MSVKILKYKNGYAIMATYNQCPRGQIMQVLAPVLSGANKRWQTIRLQALRRDGYKCREAARYGKQVQAGVVHHIWPAEDYPEYAYCLWNLVSLSVEAHDAMHDRKTRKLTALGLAWKNRTPPPLVA